MFITHHLRANLQQHLDPSKILGTLETEAVFRTILSLSNDDVLTVHKHSTGLLTNSTFKFDIGLNGLQWRLLTLGEDASSVMSRNAALLWETQSMM